jgi:hypothetical protein
LSASRARHPAMRWSRLEPSAKPRAGEEGTPRLRRPPSQRFRSRQSAERVHHPGTEERRVPRLAVAATVVVRRRGAERVLARPLRQPRNSGTPTRTTNQNQRSSSHRMMRPLLVGVQRVRLARSFLAGCGRSNWTPPHGPARRAATRNDQNSGHHSQSDDTQQVTVGQARTPSDRHGAHGCRRWRASGRSRCPAACTSVRRRSGIARIRDEGLQRDLAWSWRAARQLMGKPGARPPPGRGGSGRR